MAGNANMRFYMKIYVLSVALKLRNTTLIFITHLQLQHHTIYILAATKQDK